MPENVLSGVRIVLVDDHPAVREGLSLLLSQKGIVISGEAENREQTLQAIAVANPDLVLVDLSLGSESGLDLIEELHARNILTLVYSMYDDAHHIESAFTAGARGYVTKREMAVTLLDAIGEILSGRRFISPVVAQVLADKFVSSGFTRVSVELLSERELEVFRRIGEGDTAAQIAKTLAISPRTVESYYARIIEKLDLSGVKDLRRFAIQYPRKK